MIKANLFEKKWRLVSLLFLIIIIFIITYLFVETAKVKSILENPQPTIIYDKDSHELIELEDTHISSRAVPNFILSYVKHGKKYEEIPEYLFPNSSFKKAVCTILADTFYSDKQLIDFYLSHMYFKNGVLGLENAAQYYFNKTIHETSQIEKVFLLSQTRSSTNTDQLKNSEKFLEKLYSEKLITENEYKEFIVGLPKLIESLHHSKTYAQSYVDYVIRELESRYGIKENEFFRKGYKVYTYLDKDIQEFLYSHYQNSKNFPKENNEIIESGMVILDHRNGEIAGLIGGRKYQNSLLNRAFMTTRQPASTFKPLMVFAPAIEKGWENSDRLKDVPMKFETFQPINYDHDYRGTVSLHEALIMSYNVPATWLLYKIGFEDGFEFINKFDLFEVTKKDGYKLANGFPSVGTSPLAMAQAYTIFPNDGKMVDAHTIKRMETHKGKVKYKEKLEEKKIIEKKTAKIMTDLLVDVVEEGTGKRAGIEGQQIAGKTGTTSYDAWFIGFNEKYVGAVWMGPDDVLPENRLKYAGDRKPLTLFKSIFSELE
jgi:penicillin-binding protein 2A